jgi:16S rRNA (adenine1518-N6/adenine1519-N6)-dimethyltransferase
LAEAQEVDALWCGEHDLMIIRYIADRHPKLDKMKVRPKKHLGQHFLKVQEIAQRIVASLTGHGGYLHLAELGPGTGVLTRLLEPPPTGKLYLFEIDRESLQYLRKAFTDDRVAIIEGDFLKKDLRQLITGKFGMIGNFPYNISSQIFFHILDYVDRVPEVVCMLQKEVASRICANPGNKIYGILSVLLGVYYHRDLLFDVPPKAFHPPPKVHSTVIRLTRNEREILPCDHALFKKIVKQGFQNRRKTLRNALKPINLPEALKDDPVLALRAEQLSVEDFIALTNKVDALWKT